MHYTTLGRTGIKVSVAGLGCGGFSRLGLGTGGGEAAAIAIVRGAMELGVNLFDTAASYGTENVLGKAIKSVARDKVVLCTKAPFRWSTGRASPEGVVAALDNSLKELDTDYIDVYQLHGVPPANYRHALDELAPVLLRERDKGKFRFLGLTETAPHDLAHETLHQAAADGAWDVCMVGFSMMHQNARERVFPVTRAHKVGTLLMFAVRNIFSQPGRLQAELRGLVERGEIAAALAENPDPLGFLVHDGGASSVIDSCYRYVRHEPGVDVVLFGTGKAAHLKTNIDSLLKPPLPEADHKKIGELFGHLVGVGLDAPHLSNPQRKP
jgi:aryl-alcohol dehydrogenase-like predicted oxidoreductase